MRCSWCEPLLGAYVETGLAPARMRAVAAHLRGCEACRALHERVRIVDALLATATQTRLAPEFSTGVMTHVRAMPAPPSERRSWLSLALFYLAATWIGGLALAVAFWPAVVTGGLAALRAGASVLQTLSAEAHAVWPIAPLATSAGVALLSIDAMLLAATIVFYRSLRPRLATYLATSKEPRA